MQQERTTDWYSGLALIGFIYVVAGLAAALVGWLTSHWGLFWATALADVAATLVVFAAGQRLGNSTVYDAYWSVAPPVIAAVWALHPDSVAPVARKVLILVVVGAWGARLTWNWARGWTGMDHEDWRYRDLREQSGDLFWLVNLFGIMLFPTVLTFLGCVPLWSALHTSAAPTGPLDVVALVVAAVAVLLESAADRQLMQFRRTNRDPARVLREGVWSWSRHPNYLGEMGFWWGLALFGVAAAPTVWWNVLGAVAITCLFNFVSVPLIEQRMLARRPHYVQVQLTTGKFLPQLW